MKRMIFGSPEKQVPSRFCKKFDYRETQIQYPVDSIVFKENTRGCLLEFPVSDDERFFGLGLQLNHMDLTGRHFTLRVNANPIAATGDSHAPVPFFVSNKGYGIYFDTARNMEVDFGRKIVKNREKNDFSENEIMSSEEELYKAKGTEGGAVIAVQIPVAKGVEIYIFEGENITDVVAQYNLLGGGGCEVPEWALGLLYRCNGAYNQQQVMDTVDYFESHNLPCSTIGLEPGWQTRCYSCSFVWNEKNFPDPQKMIDELYDKGYHVNLWEHAFIHPLSPIYKEMKAYSGNYEVWDGLVPDFSISEAREIFIKHHRENVTYGKIDGLKLDECDSSDYTNGWSFPLCSEFPSGLDGEQYHMLFGALYMRTGQEIIGDKPFLSNCRSAGALCSSYPFVLYSDLYKHKDFIRGLVTAGFSGLLWTPEVRECASREDFLRRMQSAVYSPQCLINAWCCTEYPWLSFDCVEEMRELLFERKKLIPRLMAAFQEYKNNGVPPIRALVSDYTDDKETYNIDDEYLLADLLVAPMVCGEKTRKVYIPEGKWVDYRTKKPVVNGWIEVTTDNIPVYEKIRSV